MNINFKHSSLLIFVLIFVFSETSFSQNLKNIRVLVYTKNGVGYVHDNLVASVKCIEDLGFKHNFKVDVSESPSVFTQSNLQKYTLLIFASTNNDVFDNDEQRLAFRRYMQAGGGFVGIHSVIGTERNWDWFKQMIGGTFVWHPKNQKFSVQMLDPHHPSMLGMPKLWERSLGDECYFMKDVYPGIKVLMANQLNTLNPSKTDSIKIAQYATPFKDYYPSVWHQSFDGGNVWITTLGHNKENYQEAIFSKHLLLGIKYIASQSKKLDYNKAYALSKDAPLQF
jgi:type 1 glutamine amidotransferase